MKAEISEISKKNRRTDAQIEKLQTSMEKLLDEAITESRHVEKDTELETLKNRILIKLLDFWRQEYGPVDEITLWAELGKPLPAAVKNRIDELEDERLVQIVGEIRDVREIQLTSEKYKRQEHKERNSFLGYDMFERNRRYLKECIWKRVKKIR